jgi:hypothetical protein
VGDVVCEGEGEAECEGEAEDDFDGFGEGDLDTSGDGDDWTGDGAYAEGCVTVGDGLATADVEVAAADEAAAGWPEEVPALVWGAGACAVEERVGWAAWAA